MTGFEPGCSGKVFLKVKSPPLPWRQSFFESKFFKNGPTLASFSFTFVVSSTLQFWLQINVKNVHPVYGAGIRTHDLWLNHPLWLIVTGRASATFKSSSTLNVLTTLFFRHQIWTMATTLWRNFSEQLCRDVQGQILQNYFLPLDQWSIW